MSFSNTFFLKKVFDFDGECFSDEDCCPSNSFIFSSGSTNVLV